ncbi:MAG: nitrate reductase molybdenum cofactor assembly chaperone [Candidatus Abyssobacteria bacterium SURF_5]|uniref:Nitrate reductase molybdenum cofactor assembly chaperone n=1 Tax=Abyssobacteria bacterium (strain SURF_5) TaxID=2093360 RepID=A0A3A4P1E2_ABYX5|nr:MAG: nitrate reductase molybdenum cofactor assembly chaperone [Candidatus Abyssubacteria bacterium SURF_5]
MRELYMQFAEILDYPTPQLTQKVESCAAALSAFDKDAVNLLQEFQQALRRHSRGELEEIYTSTFDLNGGCCLYAGHYIFGEDFRRSLLMVKLKELYRETGFSAAKELPDHLCVMLKFLAGAGDCEECEDLVADCMIPAISAMIKSFKSKRHPYKTLLECLLRVLERQESKATEANAD